ncbi:MAG: cbb3-type cytochrome oxidase assembly protein CcoS [Cytophagales bacterium]|nr:cbb3-type cytochrome oxidase assembly protein CcoS [Rhizobacter sp.]
MDSLYLLLPVSVLLVLALIGVFAWAVNAGQFDDLDREGWRVLEGGEEAPTATKAQQAGVPLDPGQL